MKTALELLRIMIIFGLLGALGWTVLENIYINSTAESYSWFGALAVFILIFVLYRNKLQFSGWYQGKSMTKISRSVSILLVSISVILILTPFLIGILADYDSGIPDGQPSDDQNSTEPSTINEQIGSDVSVNSDITIELAVSAKNLPENFNRLAFKREEVPLYEYFVKKADNPSDYKNTWDLYEFRNKPPRINFTEKDAVFIGLYESGEGLGNCPKMINNIQWDADQKRMTVLLNEQTGQNDSCEERATPRTHVLKVPKDVSQKLNKLILVEKHDGTAIKTEVPINS